MRKEKSMFCAKCGTQVNESDVFCPKCGYKLNESSDIGQFTYSKIKKGARGSKDPNNKSLIQIIKLVGSIIGTILVLLIICYSVYSHFVIDAEERNSGNLDASALPK